MPTSTVPSAVADDVSDRRPAGAGTPRADAAQTVEVPDRQPLKAREPASPDDPAGYRAALSEAAARIGEWVPKGVHFGWERSFRNKAKFPATMSKDDARELVADLLLNAALAIYPNCREGVAVPGQVIVVAEAGRPIGTRGQRRVRIILIPDDRGFLVDNAFPVRSA